MIEIEYMIICYEYIQKHCYFTGYLICILSTTSDLNAFYIRNVIFLIYIELVTYTHLSICVKVHILQSALKKLMLVLLTIGHNPFNSWSNT